jgi:MFS family permease
MTDYRRVAVLVGLLFGMAGLGTSAAAIALPVLAESLGVTTGVSAWAISLYALLLAVATAVYGRVSDLVGIRGPLLFGIGLMSTGAILAAAAPSFVLLLVGRVLQGAGAAAVPTLGVAILSRRYSGRTRSAALGTMAGVTAAVSCLGPLVGGTVEHLLGWRAVIALPVLGALFLPLLWHALPTGGTGARLDVLGALLVAGTSTGVVMLVQSPATGPVVAVLGAVLVVLGAPAVAWWLRRRPEGFLPVSVVRSPGVVRSSVAAASVPASWFALLIAVPAVLVGDGWEPWQVGLALLPSAATGLAAPRVAAPLLDRIGGPAALVVSGSSAALALLVSATGALTGSAALLVAAVVVVTFSFGLGQPALMAVVGDAVPADVRGVALGLATLMFLVGGGVGSAVVGGLADALSMAGALGLLAVLALVAMLPVARVALASPEPLD